MKSFSQFWEEATLSDLERQHSQSAEGKMQARLSARKRAEAEAKRRASASKNFTKRNRRKMRFKKHEAEARISQQRQNAEELKAKQRAQREKAQHTARRTARSVSRAAKGTYQLGKIAIKGVRNVMKKRRDRNQTGTQEG